MTKTPHVGVLVAVAAVSAIVFGVASSAHAGKLDDTRDAVRGSGSSGGGGGGSGGEYGSSDGGGSGVTLPPIMACATPIGAIFCIPHMIFEPAEDKDERTASFWRYPYQKGASGHMLYLGNEVDHEPAGAAPVSFRLAAEYAYDWDVVHRPSGYALLETTLPLRPGLETGWTTYLEPLDARIEHLTIGDVNLTFRFAQAKKVEFRAGVGARFMFDDGNVNGGFNFTYGVDVFPVKPMIFSLSSDLGNLGNTFFFNARATVGVAVRRLEIYAGYEVTMIRPVVFHGPVAGVRAWF